MKRFILLFLALVVTLPEVLAQSFYSIRRERDLIAVVGLGVSSYYGELNNPSKKLSTDLNINVGLQYYLSNRVSVRGELTWFHLQGADWEGNEGSGREERNLSFTSNNIELNAVGMVNLFPMGQRFYQRPNFNFYGFAGIAGIYMNPKAEYQGQKYALQPLQTENIKYSRFQFAIPYGFGGRLKVGPFVNITLEGGWRLMFTDYLDDISTVHQDPASFSDPIAAALSDRRPEIGLPLAPAGTKRGNPEKNDQYFLLNLKAEIYLPSGIFGMNSQRKLYNRKRRAIYRRR